MRTVRIWLLLLLAVLVPVRGAVAAAMLCPMPGAGGQVKLTLQHQASLPAHHAMDEATADAGHASMQDHPGAQHDHGAGHHEHGTSNQPDKCNMCSAFCSLTPLVSTTLTVAPPLEIAHSAFPPLSAPAPSFLSDGQERPPRSI